MPERRTKSVVIGAGGAVVTALLPYYLVELRSRFDVNLAVAVSAGALQFCTESALRAITNSPVYTPAAIWDPVSAKPFHLAYNDPDMLVIFPATARILVEASQGAVTCPVTRLIAFTSKSLIHFHVSLHPAMDRRVYQPALGRLREFGCSVSEDAQPNVSSWRIVIGEIVSRLNLVERTNVPENSKLF